MRFKLRHMEVFRAVMLTGSVNAASKLLFVSQPAVSKLVSHVETTLGLRLFERSKGRLVPTAEAHALFREVEQVYQAAVRVDEFAHALALGPSSLLRVSCSASLAMSVVAPALVELKRKLPALTVSWQTTLMADMPMELLSKEAEVAIAAMPVLHEHLENVPFMYGSMVCAMPKGHRLEAQQEVSLADLADEPVVLFKRDIPFGTVIAQACQQAGVELKSTIDVMRADQALALVEGGLGVTIVDNFATTGSALVIRPLREAIDLTAHFVYSRFAPPSRNASVFMQAVYKRATLLERAIPEAFVPE
ncbi:LysR family transcriptional regulator (plasmid) [Burkholderia sp. SFA1]|uniref:LysR family transcriptional regulator n=1 Tax=unclassified Caballeronia TaxID=2646786 RepID=UPI001F3BDFC3|nr:MULTISPECIES: LysR family transcriptional regulator [unclassified Caballeronia]MCE4547008.1 LysR family transcriptional regulator [Caballeronia sp. PC1]MCE4572519.1 LysR family transcriptional regulator [Caballeronia sp. CLC5]BBQ02108.1 LysR family transcriptional regulator [Burkholderia sp. SFA1]